MCTMSNRKLRGHAEFISEMYSTQVSSAPGHYQASIDELRGLTEFEDQEAWFSK